MRKHSAQFKIISFFLNNFEKLRDWDLTLIGDRLCFDC